jgi:hypothetical protein
MMHAVERWHLGVSEFIFKENGSGKKQGANTMELMCTGECVCVEHLRKATVCTMMETYV